MHSPATHAQNFRLRRPKATTSMPKAMEMQNASMPWPSTGEISSTNSGD